MSTLYFTKLWWRWSYCTQFFVGFQVAVSFFHSFLYCLLYCRCICFMPSSCSLSVVKV